MIDINNIKIGDVVYYLRNNKIKSGVIYKIEKYTRYIYPPVDEVGTTKSVLTKLYQDKNKNCTYIVRHETFVYLGVIKNSTELEDSHSLIDIQSIKDCYIDEHELIKHLQEIYGK